MWYNKNVGIERIAKLVRETEFSTLAEKTMKLMVVEYCYMHQVSYKDRQRIGTKLGIRLPKVSSGAEEKKS